MDLFCLLFVTHLYPSLAYRALLVSPRSFPFFEFSLGLPSPKSSECFPWAMRIPWKSPLPSTSSPGAQAPGVDATNLEGKTPSSAVTSSAEILDWPQLCPKRRKIKRQVLFLPFQASSFDSAKIKNKTKPMTVKISHAGGYRLSSKWGPRCPMLSVEPGPKKTKPCFFL